MLHWDVEQQNYYLKRDAHLAIICISFLWQKGTWPEKRRDCYLKKRGKKPVSGILHRSNRNWLLWLRPNRRRRLFLKGSTPLCNYRLTINGLIYTRQSNFKNASTKVFEEALNAIKILVLLKKFGLSQKFFGPVKGQGVLLTEVFAQTKIQKKGRHKVS